MPELIKTKPHRKMLMAYLRYLCREQGVTLEKNPLGAVAELAGEEMTWQEAIQWLDGQMRKYPPPSYVKPEERPEQQPAAKRKKSSNWQKTLNKARQREGSREGHQRKLERDAALVARAEMRMKKHRGEKPAMSKKSAKQGRWTFYKSQPWRELRARVFEKYGGKCCLCGRSHREDGVKIHADHIKPRSKYPRLELVESNIQLLCEDCNLGKGNKFATDWRPSLDPSSPAPQESAHNPQAGRAVARPASA